jgi:hypothetical protein
MPGHPLDAARGIVNGLLIVLPFWAAVIWWFAS